MLSLPKDRKLSDGQTGKLYVSTNTLHSNHASTAESSCSPFSAKKMHKKRSLDRQINTCKPDTYIPVYLCLSGCSENENKFVYAVAAFCDERISLLQLPPLQNQHLLCHVVGKRQKTEEMKTQMELELKLEPPCVYLTA